MWMNNISTWQQLKHASDAVCLVVCVIILRIAWLIYHQNTARSWHSAFRHRYSLSNACTCHKIAIRSSVIVCHSSLSIDATFDLCCCVLSDRGSDATWSSISHLELCESRQLLRQHKEVSERTQQFHRSRHWSAGLEDRATPRRHCQRTPVRQLRSRVYQPGRLHGACRRVHTETVRRDRYG